MQQSDLATLVRVLRDDLAPRSATESTVVVDRPHGRLHRYGSADQVVRARDAGAVPVLLVPPLAVPASCYDLAPGADPANSVVEFLLGEGTIPYVVDFGDVGRAERHLGFEDYFDTFVPRAVADVLADFGAPGGSLDLMAWSLGGTLSLMTAAHGPQLPIRSVITVGTPLDYLKIPPYPLVHRLLGPTGGRPATYALRAMAGIPAPIVRAVYRGLAVDREVRKPLFILKNLDDRDALSRMQVIDRFQRSLPGYPGRVAEQMLLNFIVRDELSTGVLHFGEYTVDLTTVAVPVFMVGSPRDVIAPIAAVRHGERLLTGSAGREFHTVNSSHLGMLTGPDAQEHTWPAVSAFRARLDG